MNLEAGISSVSGWELRARGAYGLTPWLTAGAVAFAQGAPGQATEYGALGTLSAHF